MTFAEARKLRPELGERTGWYAFEVTERAALCCCQVHEAPYQTYDKIKDGLVFKSLAFDVERDKRGGE